MDTCGEVNLFIKMTNCYFFNVDTLSLTHSEKERGILFAYPITLLSEKSQERRREKYWVGVYNHNKQDET